MRIKPKIKYRHHGETPVYQCECGYCFMRIDLLSNKKIRGEYDFCPRCKVKFIFTKENI